MLAHLRPRLTYANVTATLALFVALGGGAYAATQINGKNLKDRSVAGKKLKRNTVTGTEVKEATLGKVPTASTADLANTANTAGLASKLAAPEGFHAVGTGGQPGFQNSWTNCGGNPETVGFYKDREGVVHLKGKACSGAHATVIFQLPAGYRPASLKELDFAAVCGCTDGGSVTLPTGQVDVVGSGFGAGVDGRVQIDSAGTGSVNLDGITFRAAS